MEKFGTVFKKLRESRHLSLADISKMGVSTSQISRFENGESDLTITKFIAILKKMNISIDEYLYKNPLVDSSLVTTSYIIAVLTHQSHWKKLIVHIFPNIRH